MFIVALLWTIPVGLCQDVSIATFQAEVTPPRGAVLCGGARIPVQAITDPLSARGIIIIPEGQDPIVLCAIDWVSIANGGHDAWRNAIAEAAGVDVSRVSVHTVHQHDAPFCDFTMEELAASQGFDGKMFDVAFARDCIQRTAYAVTAAMKHPRPITHVGIGEAEVENVASNRRILGPDGKVQYMRFTATADPEIRAFPAGTIDPMLKAVSFWDGDIPLVVMTYYATHPQSHYGNGMVSADFPGMARSMRERALPSAKHIHFNGAGGNIGAGKWNDGSHANRPVLAGRLADGMQRAWEDTTTYPLTADGLEWRTDDVVLPPREGTTLEAERAKLVDVNAEDNVRMGAVGEIAYRERVAAGRRITLGVLSLGPVAIVCMPGELFVEYQLAAQALRPDIVVCMAAYGDCGPGYIGTAVAYAEGGYETSPAASLTSPEVETVLMGSLRTLLSRR
jgi:hypothetical protein